MQAKLLVSHLESKVSKQWIRQYIWLSPAFFIACIIYSSYLATHQYPAFGGGLFLSMAEQIAKHGYWFPRVIPQYTTNGVPFAYPPLVFYVLAIFHGEFGVDLFTVTRFLPGLITITSLIPFYLFSKELLQSPQRAGMASFILAVSPAFVRWHFSAGGVVRAPAFLFSLCGLYTALKLFKTTSWRWSIPTILWCTLTALTHPEYTVFLAVSIIVFAVTYERTVRGVVYTGIIGMSGFFLTTPWWGRIISIYSVENLVSASSTHGGLGGGFEVIVGIFSIQSYSSVGFSQPLHIYGVILLSLWYAVQVTSVAYLLLERRYSLPVWLLIIGAITGELRFIALIGSLVTTVFLLDGVVPRITHWIDPLSSRRHALTAILLTLTILGASISTLYVTGSINDYGGSNSMPSFLDDQDYTAMRWVQQNVEPSAEFVVIGDAAEWFPYLANRTNIVGPWGVEWERSPVAYKWQYTAYQRISTTTTVDELTKKLALLTASPEYIYIPKGRYTVYGQRYNQRQAFIRDLNRSNMYKQVYENRGVIIFERTNKLSTSNNG